MLIRPLGIREYLYASLIKCISQPTREESQPVVEKLADIICPENNQIYGDYVSKNVSDELIAYLDFLMKSNKLANTDLVRLIEAIENFYLSRNYSLQGRYQKQSFFGFTIVKHTSLFNRLLSNLSALKAKIKSDSSQKSLINELTNVITTTVKAFTKNPLLSILFLSNFQASIAEAQNTIVKEDGLVAAYLFEGNAIDNSGNHHDGVVYGAKLVSDQWGNPNNAYEFDGNSYILGPSNGFPTDEFTFMAWLLPYAHQIDPSRDRGGSFFGYGGNGAAGTSFIATLNPKNIAEPNNYYFAQHGNVNKVTVEDKINPGSKSEWIHLAVTNSKETGFTVYINGEFVKQFSIFMNNIYVQNKNFAFATLVNEAGVGPYSDENVPYWNGVMDRVFIFNYAQSESQIKKRYQEVTKIGKPDDNSFSWPYLLLAGGVGGAIFCVLVGGYAIYKIKRQKIEISDLKKEVSDLKEGSNLLRAAEAKNSSQSASDIMSQGQHQSTWSMLKSALGLNRGYDRLSSDDPDEAKQVSDPSNHNQESNPRAGDLEIQSLPQRSVTIGITSESKSKTEAKSESDHSSSDLDESKEIPPNEQARIEQVASLAENLLPSQQPTRSASQLTQQLPSVDGVSSQQRGFGMQR